MIPMLPADRLDSLDSVSVLNSTVHHISHVNFIDSRAISGIQSTFGPGTGPIHLDDLRCAGTEDTLFSCPHGSTPNCVHSEDAAIACVPRREFSES
jgi:hypothetical protein